MKRPMKLSVALLAIALAAICFTPTSGKADYYGWGWGGGYWPTYSGYYPGYTAGYFPSYWDGYYGGGLYTAGYYPLSWSSYYGGSCCGGCGSCGWSGCGSCSYGCGSCGSCSSGCGSCGLSCGSCGLGCGSCCGSSCCGTSLACGNSCGAPAGSDCSGGVAGKPGARKSAPPEPEDKFEPRSSPRYDDEPPAQPPGRSRKKAPTEPPAGGATGGASLEGPGGDTSGAGKYTRDKATEGRAKPAASDDYKPPVKSPAGTSPNDQFEAKKPVSPAPDADKKKAPMPKIPGAGALDAGRAGNTALNESEPDVFTNNPALALQDRATWSYSGSLARAQDETVTRVALIGNPVPRRLKSPVVESPAVRMVENLARN